MSSAWPKWLKDDGSVVSCFEKVKVMEENLNEIRQMAQDAFEETTGDPGREGLSTLAADTALPLLDSSDVETWVQRARSTSPAFLQAQAVLGWPPADVEALVASAEAAAGNRVRLKAVYCLGLCACGPAAQVNGELIGRATSDRLVAEVSA